MPPINQIMSSFLIIAKGRILSTFSWSLPSLEEFLILISKAVLVFRKNSESNRETRYLSDGVDSLLNCLNNNFAILIGSLRSVIDFFLALEDQSYEARESSLANAQQVQVLFHILFYILEVTNNLQRL